MASPAEGTRRTRLNLRLTTRPAAGADETAAAAAGSSAPAARGLSDVDGQQRPSQQSGPPGGSQGLPAEESSSREPDDATPQRAAARSSTSPLRVTLDPASASPASKKRAIAELNLEIAALQESRAAIAAHLAVMEEEHARSQCASQYGTDCPCPGPSCSSKKRRFVAADVVEPSSVKRPKIPKPALWKDIPSSSRPPDRSLLGVFPVEVLDLIISIDSDLDLRDHLALAGTCRFFRRCYTDVVFQVLFDAFRVPSHLASKPMRGVADYEVFDAPLPGASCGTEASFVDHRYPSSVYEIEDGIPLPPALGPFARSWTVARHIFSSAGSSGHGDVWDDWGSTSAEHAAGEAQRATMKAALLAALRPSSPHHLRPTTPWSDVPVAQDIHGVFEVDMDDEERTRCLAKLPEWQREMTTTTWAAWEATRHDPLRSRWRILISRIVNEPEINKTQAKAVYRVSDRELLTLPTLVDERQRIRYRLAAVQALAYRSHGGPLGHRAYVAKLAAAAEKRKAQRIAIGSMRPPVPAATVDALAAHDWEDWTADGMV